MPPWPVRVKPSFWNDPEGTRVNTYTLLIIEFTVMAAIWLMASGLTIPLRRRIGKEGGSCKAISTLMLDVFAYLSRPLLVLALTQLVVLLTASWTPLIDWFAVNHSHLTAWQIFWLGVGAISLVEGVTHAVFRWRGEAFPIPDLLLDIIRAALVLAIAFLVLRMALGINIGPLLASTALLTAVIGFALQGVLGNLLAGMSLHLVQTLKPGIWIDVDGVEGRIIKTNWRETRIRTRGGHMYIIPNARIAESKIHNYNEPTPLRRHVVNVGASYSDAPDEVIEAMLASARAVSDVRHNPAPEAMITEFQDYGINYRLEFWTTELQRHNPIDGAVNRNIWYQFKRKGIEIPFPMSDKLLNDFMAVVYKQRKLPPVDVDIEAVVTDLWQSDLCSKVFVDTEGRPLLSHDDLTTIAPLVKRQPYTHGETVCVQGDTGETFWVIARGKLQGKVEQDGKVAAEFELPTGTVVGEMGALTGVPRSATLSVAESAELLEFGTDAFRTLLSLHEDVPERLSKLAADRADQNREALEDLAKNRDNGAEVQLEQKGILRRLLRIMGR